MAQHGPRAVPGDQGVQFGLLRAEGGAEGGAGQFGHVLLGVVHPGGQVGVEALQRGLDAPDAFGQPPVEGGFCQGGPLAAVGGDDFHNGLGLGQAQAAVFQGAAGELPRRGGHGPGQQQGFQQAVGHGGAAVDRKLDHILAGVGVGRAEEQRDGLVHFLPAQGVVAQQGGVAAGRGHGAPCAQRGKDFFHDGVGVGAGHPHHGDAALPRRGGQRADGLLKTVHGKLL